MMQIMSRLSFDVIGNVHAEYHGHFFEGNVLLYEARRKGLCDVPSEAVCRSSKVIDNN